MVVVPLLNLPHIPCATEEEALEKSLELIQKRGRQLELEIRKNESKFVALTPNNILS